jgi:hypothetical protein
MNFLNTLKVLAIVQEVLTWLVRHMLFSHNTTHVPIPYMHTSYPWHVYCAFGIACKTYACIFPMIMFLLYSG